MKKYSIGIDLGGTKILLALVDKFSGEVVLSVKKKTRKEKGPEKIMSKMIDGIEELLEDSGAGIDEISSIGVGAAGQIDREHGILIGAPNLDCFDLNIKQQIQSHFDIPVYVGNDVEIAAIGEMKFGAATGCDEFVCVFFGTVVVCAIVKNGKIIYGPKGTPRENR